MATRRAAKPASAPLRARGRYQANKEELLTRFRRLNGQITGIAGMVEEERYCPEVLVQLSAAIAALEKIGYILLRDHVRYCVTEGINAGEGDEYLDELIASIQRFSGR
ncbi:MAG TPA: metal-sensitive transcriptional regulator [Candidatus Dormibacteraeota bacterium]|jgi:DNA-binding FrmR family transcriptional regulator|nr:metal-sensitive transcriptional regulator [Candidatus Dormibacteraeota bacterium]